jgi:hypothetical protein
MLYLYCHGSTIHVGVCCSSCRSTTRQTNIRGGVETETVSFILLKLVLIQTLLPTLLFLVVVVVIVVVFYYFSFPLLLLLWLCCVYHSLGLYIHQKFNVHIHLLVSDIHRTTKSNRSTTTTKYIIARKDVNRSMVTVSIPFLAPDKGTAKAFQFQVVESVRSAIANHFFTKLDLGE